MVRGFYAAATGMEVQRKKMDVITNNMTNVDTQGYKKEWLVSTTFDEVLIERRHDSTAANETGPFTFGTRIDEVFVDFTQGSFEETGETTDIALAGEGFFVVSTPGGERLTRASAFDVDYNGYIVDSNGYYLLGQNGPINVGTDDFSINDRGGIIANGRNIDTIRVMTAADVNDLQKQGENLYYSESGYIAADAGRYAVKQGFVEGSNVNIAREMVDMMTVYRVYESNQKALQMVDELTGRAVNEIAPVR